MFNHLFPGVEARLEIHACRRRPGGIKHSSVWELGQWSVAKHELPPCCSDHTIRWFPARGHGHASRSLGAALSELGAHGAVVERAPVPSFRSAYSVLRLAAGSMSGGLADMSSAGMSRSLFV